MWPTVKKVIVALAMYVSLSFTLLQARDPETFTFYSWDRNRTYSITTQQVAYSLIFPGHWMYQPSVILPGPETNNNPVLVFNSNLTAYSTSDQAIWVSYSTNGSLQFPAPTAILRMSQSSNICDMADARAIYDGSQWHVYVQALLKAPNGSCSGGAHIVQAIGPSLNALGWDVYPGTQTARIIVAGIQPGGIGEDQQLFYEEGSPLPFVVLYNDWSNPQGGAKLMSARSADGTNFTPWYSADPAGSPWLEQQGYTNTLVYPDALLSGSLDEAAWGPVGMGIQSSCFTSGGDANKYQYSRIFGYFPNPMQSSALNGAHGGLAVRSTSYDSHGERTFRPRLARDSHGYIPLAYSNEGFRQWSTYVFYNPTQINYNSGDGCNVYSRWNSYDQQFAFSLMYITEY